VVLGLFLLYAALTVSEIYFNEFPANYAITNVGETLVGNEGLQYNKNRIEKYKGVLTNELIEEVLQSYKETESINHVTLYFENFRLENQTHITVENAYPYATSALTYGFSAGWETFLRKRLQIMTVFPLILMVLFCPLFPYEYQCGMSSVLLTTKNGKIKSAKAKILIAFIITNITFLVVTGLQALLYYIRYGIEGYDTSIQVGLYNYFNLSALSFNYLDLSLNTLFLNLLGINMILLIIIGVSIKSYNSIQSLLISVLLCYSFSPELISRIFSNMTAFYVISLHPINSLDTKNIACLDYVDFLGRENAWINFLQIFYIVLIGLGLFYVCKVMVKKQKYYSD